MGPSKGGDVSASQVGCTVWVHLREGMFQPARLAVWAHLREGMGPSKGGDVSASQVG